MFQALKTVPNTDKKEYRLRRTDHAAEKKKPPHTFIPVSGKRAGINSATKPPEKVPGTSSRQKMC
jgi:hypothetical protein